MSAFRGPLGHNPAPDRKHIDAFPVTGGAATPTKVPVVIGINWYTSMDEPQKQKDGSYIFRSTNVGTVRGGHCTALEPNNVAMQDALAWWTFYNQGEEGACEGFGHSRAMSLIHRATFNAFWLYDDARRFEGAYPNGEGSTNRSACGALAKWGDHPLGGAETVRTPWKAGVPSTEIKAYRWCTTWQQVLDALGYKQGPVPLLNSWGTQYPHRVLVPDELGVRLIETEGGEADVFTSN